MSSPRPSTDEENAPLLDGDRNEYPRPRPRFQRLAERLRLHKLSEPAALSPFEKALLALLLLFAVVGTVFIGLFAGAERQLKHRPTPTHPPASTVTHTEHHTATATYTLPPPSSTPVPSPPPGQDEEVCTSAQCVLTAASILSSIDTTVDPCSSLYQFAAGGWLKEHPVPASKGNYGIFESVSDRNRAIVRDIIHSSPHLLSSSPSSDEANLHTLRTFYSTCLDESAQNARGARPLLDVVDALREVLRDAADAADEEFEEALAGLRKQEKRKHHKEGKKKEERGKHGKEGKEEKEKRRSRQLTAALAYLHSRGIPALFSFILDGDVGKHPSKQVPWLFQDGFGLPDKAYYLEDDALDYYRGVVHDVLRAVYDRADADDSSRPAKRSYKWLAEDVVKFEAALAKVSADNVELADPIGTYNPFSPHNLHNAFPSLSWPTYFASYSPRPRFPHPIIVSSPSYLSRLAELVAPRHLNDETLEAYLVVRASLELGKHLGPQMQVAQATARLEGWMKGLPEGTVQPREDRCLEEIDEQLGFLAGRYFVQEAFPGDSKATSEAIIDSIIDAFIARLPALDWLDKPTAKAAAEKARVLHSTKKIGYPTSNPNTTDPDSLARYYAGHGVTPNDYFGNVLRGRVAEEQRKWARVGREAAGEWDMVPDEVNAYYQPSKNEIVFPAGILQPPFFQRDWPLVLQYGGMGSIASHELTHAFDSSGRLYDKDGRLLIDDPWWSNATAAEFEKRKQCVVDQYDGYTVDNGKGGVEHVNGKLVVGEAIADLGIRQSWDAWKAAHKKELAAGKKKVVLPGLNFTDEQLFFIAWARTWARSIRPTEAVRRVRVDPHAPNNWRVDGTAANTHEFAKAFNCPMGSKLNPPESKQCRLW